MHEWRPYLSFRDMRGSLRISHETGNADTNFTMYLINVGKCHLKYEVTKFDIFLNDQKLGEKPLENLGSVVCASTEASFRKSPLAVSLYPPNKPDDHKPPQCRIDIALKYYKTDLSTQEYDLQLPMLLEFASGATEKGKNGELYSVYNVVSFLYGNETIAN